MIPIARPQLGKEEAAAVKDVLMSGMLAQGSRVQEFEEAFAEFIGVKYAVATSNGTTALQVALLASGVGEGDEVITTPFSFIASSNSILFSGARPVFVDISDEDFNVDPDRIEEKITGRTKAVLVVHLYGQPCDMSAISEITRRHRLLLIEDACQAHGATYGGKSVGSFGDVGCFSFYPTKNMTTGEGGMIVTNKKRIASKARLIRNHGQVERYLHKFLGYNFRMTDIAAALGSVQLRKLAGFNRKRIGNARYLTNKLDGVAGIVPPRVFDGRSHVFHQYTIRVTRDYPLSRDGLKSRLEKRGIGCRIFYPRIIPDQPVYRQLGYRVSLPVARRLAKEVISLPVHPAVTRNDLDFIVATIEDASR